MQITEPDGRKVQPAASTESFQRQTSGLVKRLNKAQVLLMGSGGNTDMVGKKEKKSEAIHNMCCPPRESFSLVQKHHHHHGRDAALCSAPRLMGPTYVHLSSHQASLDIRTSGFSREHFPAPHSVLHHRVLTLYHCSAAWRLHLKRKKVLLWCARNDHLISESTTRLRVKEPNNHGGASGTNGTRATLFLYYTFFFFLDAHFSRSTPRVPWLKNQWIFSGLAAIVLMCPSAR